MIAGIVSSCNLDRTGTRQGCIGCIPAIPVGGRHYAITSLIFPGSVLADEFPVQIANPHGENRQGWCRFLLENCAKFADYSYCVDIAPSEHLGRRSIRER